MKDTSVTASAVISFSAKLEDASAAFYEVLADRWPDSKETFLAFADGCRKSRVLVTRTYQETITDALEACFSFEGLELSAYTPDTTVASGADRAAALKLAVALEEKASSFYLDVAERSQALLATIPGAFRRAAKTRAKRKNDLESMLHSG